MELFPCLALIERHISDQSVACLNISRRAPDKISKSHCSVSGRIFAIITGFSFQVSGKSGIRPHSKNHYLTYSICERFLIAREDYFTFFTPLSLLLVVNRSYRKVHCSTCCSFLAHECTILTVISQHHRKQCV